MTNCARYWGSDGTLCSTHHGRFASTQPNRCVRATLATQPSPEPLREALLDAAKDAHALAVRHLPNPGCSGDFETCPSLYCAHYRSLAASGDQGEERP